MTTIPSAPAATLAHSHTPLAPAASRAERRVSFDINDFPIPTGREEEWRFTPLDRLGRVLEDVGVEGNPKVGLEGLPASVTFVELDPKQARESAVRAPGDRASAIAAAHSNQRLLVSVAPGTEVAHPVEVEVTGRGRTMRRHVTVRVGEASQATMVVTYAGSAECSQFISVDVLDGADLNLVLLIECEIEAVFVTDLAARLGRNSRLRMSTVNLGGGVSRMSTAVELAGEGAQVDLFGIYLAQEGQHVENRVFVDHAAPRCRSRVTYKGALSGETARSVWVGDVLIRANAVGTDTYELNRNLILSDGARADSVPNLEIETGEIERAGHASATGRFDEEQMFYLRSRGIPEHEARRLIVHGFFTDVIHELGVPRIERDLLKTIEARLEDVDA